MGPSWRINLMTHHTMSKRYYHWGTCHSLERKVEMGKVMLEGKLIYFASPDPGVSCGAMGCLKKSTCIIVCDKNIQVSWEK